MPEVDGHSQHGHQQPAWGRPGAAGPRVGSRGPGGGPASLDVPPGGRVRPSCVHRGAHERDPRKCVAVLGACHMPLPHAGDGPLHGCVDPCLVGVVEPAPPGGSPGSPPRTHLLVCGDTLVCLSAAAQLNVCPVRSRAGETSGVSRGAGGTPTPVLPTMGALVLAVRPGSA